MNREQKTYKKIVDCPNSCSSPFKDAHDHYVWAHNQLRIKYGRATFCIFDAAHIAKRYAWANVTEEYSGNLEDYLPMCYPCHGKFDFSEKSIEKRRATGVKQDFTYLYIPIAKCLGNKIVEKYESASIAAEENNLLRTSINNALKGLSKSAGGYQWNYL